MDPRFTLVLPIHNEAASLDACLSRFRAALERTGCEHEVILVENGSTDATWETANKWIAGFPGWRCIRREAANRSEALRFGVEEARGDRILLMDVDHYDLSFIDKARVAAAAGVFVIGSKHLAEGLDDRPKYRRWVSLVYNGILRRIWGWPISDVHGPKMFERGALDLGRLPPDLQVDIALLAQAYRRGSSFKEIPIIVREQRPSQRGGLFQLVFMLRTLGRSWNAAR